MHQQYSTQKEFFLHFLPLPNFEHFSILEHKPVTDVTTYKMVI